MREACTGPGPAPHRKAALRAGAVDRLERPTRPTPGTGAPQLSHGGQSTQSLAICLPLVALGVRIRNKHGEGMLCVGNPTGPWVAWKWLHRRSVTTTSCLQLMGPGKPATPGLNEVLVPLIMFHRQIECHSIILNSAYTSSSSKTVSSLA